MKNIKAAIKTNRLPVKVDSQFKKNIKRVPFIIIGVVCITGYYLLNINTPPIGDDILLQFVSGDWGTERITAPRVTNMSQMLIGLLSFYFNFRGRVIAQGLAQLFAVCGKQHFNLINSIVFVGIMSLVYFHSNYGKKANWRLYLIICAMFWFLTPDFVTITLWMTASLDTSWPVFFILLFLVPYRILVSEKGEVGRPAITTMFVIAIGFIAGQLNEWSFGLSIGFAFLAITFFRIKRGKVPKWSVFGLLSTICGTLFMLLSPGYKSDCLEKYGETPLKHYINSFPGNVLSAVEMSFKVTKVLLLVTVIICIWLIVDIRKKPTTLYWEKKQKRTEKKFSIRAIADNKNGLFIPSLFFITTVGSIIIVTALPFVDYRAYFTIFVSFSLVFFNLFSEAVSHIDISKIKLKNTLSSKYLRTALPVLICLITLFDFGKEYRIYHQHFQVYTDVVQSIETKIAAGEKDIIIHNKTEIPQRLLPEGRIQSIIDYWSITSVIDDPNFVLNKWYAYYLGADTLKGERKLEENKSTY